MLKVIELFSGLGSQSAALKRLGVDYKIIHTCEIDKDVMLSYAAIHCDYLNISKTYEYPDARVMVDYLQDRNIGYDFKSNKPYAWQRLIDKVTGQAKKDLKKYYLACVLSNNIGDISKVEKLDYADFWTYSFCCQDISVAGKRAGIIKGLTRSGLLYEVERLLEKSQEIDELPKYLMLENVKNLVGKQFKPQFIDWIERLDQLGYNTYWQVLNSKNYGVPQNRERVFAISIRKDIDTGYTFPEPFDNGKRLKDILESEVDEKFYISQEKVKPFITQLTTKINKCENSYCIDANYWKGTTPQDFIKKSRRQLVIGIDKSINNTKEIEYLNCITAREDRGISNHQSKGNAVLQIGNIVHTGNFKNPQRGRIYSEDGCSPALNCCGGGGLEPKIMIPQATKQGYIECNVPGVCDLTYPNSKTRRGRVQDGGEICPTLTASTQDICAIELPCIAASRGRNPDNPSDRTVGAPTEQRLEVNRNGTSNVITSVQKDNYVLEPQTLRPERNEYGKKIRKDYEAGIISESRHNMTDMKPRKDGITGTLTTVQKDNYVIEPNFRIRKLTPKECFFLMGFSDEDFHKAESVCSNSQLYKQAGNSIVVDVLYYIFKNLFIENVQVSNKEELKMKQLTIFDIIKLED